MTSQRAVIRQRVMELLFDKTEALDRVFPNRARQLWPEELPAILVYTRSENVTEFDHAPRSLKRDLRLAVEVVAKADEQLDDQLDEIARQVEDALLGEDTLGGVCSDCLLSDVELALTGEGETLWGTLLMTFQITYFTEVKDSDVELANLERVNVDYRLNEDEISDAVDTIELPTE